MPRRNLLGAFDLDSALQKVVKVVEVLMTTGRGFPGLSTSIIWALNGSSWSKFLFFSIPKSAK